MKLETTDFCCNRWRNDSSSNWDQFSWHDRFKSLHVKYFAQNVMLNDGLHGVFFIGESAAPKCFIKQLQLENITEKLVKPLISTAGSLNLSVSTLNLSTCSRVKRSQLWNDALFLCTRWANVEHRSSSNFLQFLPFLFVKPSDAPEL